VFEVKYDNNDCITALKEKVKRKKRISLPANELAVWQCKEPNLSADVNFNELENTLSVMMWFFFFFNSTIYYMEHIGRLW